MQIKNLHKKHSASLSLIFVRFLSVIGILKELPRTLFNFRGDTRQDSVLSALVLSEKNIFIVITTPRTEFISASDTATILSAIPADEL